MARPRVLVFQHVPFEPLGTLDPLLRDAGFRVRYVNFGRDPAARPRLSGYDGLIVLGGPMSANDVEGYPNLATETGLIREAVAAEKEVLGICLGAQLVARALGGSVAPAPEKEIGWHEVTLSEAGRRDEVLGEFAPVQRVFQWHGDNLSLPPGGAGLASSPVCPHQAFRVGESVLGLQFHLEVNEALIERWLRVPDNQAELAEAAGQVDPAQVRAETPGYIGALNALSERTFGRWMARFGAPRRRRALPSR